MKRTIRTLTLFGLLTHWALADDVIVDGKRFRVPDGFTLEKVAGPPLVDRPITAAFDEAGRLYVADSSGTNDSVQKQLAERPHRIVLLTDSDGDGRFDKRTVFADKMMFPEGTMWFDGSLYVSAPPQIWKLTDTNDDGVADQREVWFDGKTLTGCANDLHGPYPGPDGRIYWAKGAFAQQTYERDNKAPFQTRAAHIFRARPDGSEIEPVMTGGMDNPVDVVFTPGGERLFNGTFFVNPGNGQRDGIIHAIYGGIYGKVHDPIYDPIHKWTGPDLMPILVHLGPAAPAGLHRYESQAFGRSFQENVFSCCFNLHKVTRHVLKPRGATFETEDSDLIVAEDLDFHPTDIIEDADGSLLIVDTGGWYKLCCPTSQLHKPDILGAIYRLRKTTSSRSADPRGLKLAWGSLKADDLVGLLGDLRTVVRERASRALAKRGAQATAALARAVRDPYPVDAQRQAVWTAARIDDPSARALVRLALSFQNETTRQAAIHAAGLWRDRAAVSTMIGLLSSESAHNRRAAAEALGRIGDPSAVSPLLAAVAKAGDRVEEHSIIYAMIEIGNAKAIREGLRFSQSPSEKVRRATLIALDQIDGSVSVETIAAELKSTDATTREVAAWVAGRHPEWGASLAAYFRERLDDLDLNETDRGGIETQVARFAKSSEVQALLVDRALKGKPGVRRSALRVMARGGLRETPTTWTDALIACLTSSDNALVETAVAAARALPVTKNKEQAAVLNQALRAIGRNESVLAPVRVDALATSAGGSIDADLFMFLRTQLSTNLPVAQRGAAAEVLGKSKLKADQLIALADLVRDAGPLEIGRLLGAFQGANDDEVGSKLTAALSDAPALSALLVDQVRTALEKFGPDVKKGADAIYAKMNVDVASQRAKIDELLALVPKGDVRRGQAVFHGPKAACIACHQMGYVGGKIGPDLTSVGKTRNERDLLEAIVYPSVSFVRSYEPVTIATAAGRVVNGILKKDAPDEVVLVVSATEEVRLPRSEIEELKPGTVSVMPAGLDQQLTPQEVADLVVFLKASNR